ncbi:MAG: FAD-dependent monooxygenase [Cyanobacteria bacterium P01_F01_bin.150]
MPLKTLQAKTSQSKTASSMFAQLYARMPFKQNTVNNGKVVSAHSPEYFRHAIVIGGSMTGLLAGHILAKHYQQVTVIERDVYPMEPTPRKGIPQSRFLHVLLQRGQLILEELFPGLTDELVSHGAPLLNDSQDICFFSQYGVAKKDASSILTISPTRGLLDWIIRRRLCQQSNIQFLEGAKVTSLVGMPDQKGIGGVHVKTADGEQTLMANLVIDASGKTSKAPQWLQALGYEAPDETFLDARIGYAHRIYELPSQPSVEWKAAIVWPSLPDQTRAAILFPVEGDRWIVGLGGAAPDYPPTNEAEYLEYARSLPTPEIYNAIKDAKPLSGIYVYRGNENRLRAYEKLAVYPDNFLVMGHAACAFNPVYGQGITMAAIEAQILDHALHQLPDALRSDWCQTIQQQFAKAEEIPWSMATEMDQQYINRNQPHTLLERFNNWYQSQLLALITRDAKVYERMTRVNHMLDKPHNLVAPGILLKIMAHQVRAWALPKHELDEPPLLTTLTGQR